MFGEIFWHCVMNTNDILFYPLCYVCACFVMGGGERPTKKRKSKNCTWVMSCNRGSNSELFVMNEERLQ